MRNIKNNVLKYAKLAHRAVRPLPVQPEFLHADVPYFCQWESRNLAQKILNHTISTDDDPKWKASGAESKKEYHDWSWTGCGMACTKMILAHRTGKVVPLVQLGKMCASYGGYTLPLEDSIGLLYKPYVTFVAREFGWQARVVQGMSIKELMHNLGLGNYVIAGVSPKIRDPQSTPAVKGGHLILMLGYSLPKKEFYFHNPSGISAKTQEYATISFAGFKKFFSERAIVIHTGE
ncbi:MAG TPA: C39 family peptidase [Candidatus Saccharimonadales bacterium]|nr:C39 family peptidase [Candidatus Saccharimonadales bacterium]